MKLNKILATAAVALIGAVSAHAATYTQGDLILGVYDPTNSSIPALEFNLGAYSSYADFGKQGLLSLNIGSEMIATFGNDWATNTNLRWGIAGYISATQFAIGVPETATLTKLSTTTAAKNAISPYVNAYSTATTASGDGYLISTTGSIKTYDDVTTYGDFGTYNKNLIVPVANDADGFKSLDLFYYSGTTNGTQENTFKIANDGSLYAVPEPSTYAMMALGGLGLFRMLRRRSIVAA